MTYEEFIEKHGIGFEQRSVESRPDGLMGDETIGRYRVRMSHYRCRIKCGRKSFGLYFSQGEGVKGVPTLAGVLDCLASDAASYENAKDFEDFAAEFGYDSDSRSAERIYRAIRRQAEQLKRTLGDEAYQELLYETERQ